MAVNRQLFIDLFARDKTAAGTRSAAKNIGDVGDAADDAAKSTDKLGKAADGTGDDIAKLSREIGLAENELTGLHRAYARTSDEIERADLSKGIRALERDLKKLGKSKGVLEGILPDPGPAAKTFMTKLGGSLAGSASSLAATAGGSVGPVVGGAIAAAAAPVLISTLGSALSAGLGAGVLGVGLAAAAKDPVVAARGKGIGQRFAKAVQDEAVEAFQGPMLTSLDRLEDAGERTTVKLGQAFDALAPKLDPLVARLTTAGERLTGSVLAGAEKAGPALDGVGRSAVLLADGVGNFIDAVADGGPEAAANLTLIAGATGDLMTYTGNTLAALNELSNSPWITGPLIPALRDHYVEAADSAGVFSRHVKGSADASRDAEDATTAQRTALAALNKELKGQTDPLFAFTTAQEGVTTAQKNLNEAIKKHGPNSKEAATGTRELAAAALDLQSKAAAVATTADGRLTPALRSTLSAAGLTETQIAGVERELGDAKKALDKYDGKYAADVAVNGAGPAGRKVRSITDDLRAFDGVWTATMVTNYVRHGKPGTGGGLSTGGIVDGPGTSTSDSIPKMLSKGEYVVRASEVAKPGVRQMLEGLNSGKGYGSPGGVPAAMGGGWTGGRGGTAVQQRIPIDINLTGAEGKFKSWIREMFRTGQLP